MKKNICGREAVKRQKAARAMRKALVALFCNVVSLLAGLAAFVVIVPLGGGDTVFGGVVGATIALGGMALTAAEAGQA